MADAAMADAAMAGDTVLLALHGYASNGATFVSAKCKAVSRIFTLAAADGGAEEEGGGLLEEVEFGIELAADALDDGDGDDRGGEVGLEPDLVPSADVEDVEEELGDLDVSEGDSREARGSSFGDAGEESVDVVHEGFSVVALVVARAIQEQGATLSAVSPDDGREEVPEIDEVRRRELDDESGVEDDLGGNSGGSRSLHLCES